MRGRKWIRENIKTEQIFVTRVDKGGAIIILDYKTVINVMEKELGDPDKFKVVSGDPDKHRISVTKDVSRAVARMFH